MKLKTFLERTNKQGKINNEDFSKALEKISDELEIPDVWVNLFDDNFLTRERASADFDIIKKIKAETLNGVDEKLKAFIPLLDSASKEEFEKEINTFKKVEKVATIIPQLLEKARGENPNSDEKVKQLEKNLKEFAEKVSTVSQEKDKTIKELLEKHEQEKVGLRTDWTLDKKLSEYVLADEFSSIRPAIIKNVVDTIKGQHSLQLDDKGQIVVVEIDPATKVAKPKFNGNDPVTIDSLLAEPLKPFLKKNNGDGGNQQQQQTTPRTSTRQAVQPTNVLERPKAKPNTPVV